MGIIIISLIFVLTFVYLMVGILFAFWLWEDQLYQPSYAGLLRYHIYSGFLLTTTAVFWPISFFYWYYVRNYRFDRPWIDGSK